MHVYLKHWVLQGEAQPVADTASWSVPVTCKEPLDQIGKAQFLSLVINSRRNSSKDSQSYLQGRNTNGKDAEEEKPNAALTTVRRLLWAFPARRAVPARAEPGQPCSGAG